MSRTVYKMKYFYIGALNILLANLFLCPLQIDACKTQTWRNMSMEEILYRSDVVVWGLDKQHAKLRYPKALDSRFEVYCVIKAKKYQIPDEIIIEAIDEEVACSNVKLQTKEGEEAIVGLTFQTSGFMKYANVNPLQSSAFPATTENFKRLSQMCELSDWRPRDGAKENKCPAQDDISSCKSFTTTPKPEEKNDSFLKFLFGGGGNGCNTTKPKLSIIILGTLVIHVSVYWMKKT